MKYGLMLNDMRQPNIENLQCVKVSSDRQELINYHNSLLVKSYKDDRWGKQFKKGSELEWFNPVYNLETNNNYFGGIYVFKDSISDEVIMNYKLFKN